MAIDKLQRFRNVEYDYKDQHDSFVARGLHLNELNDKLSMTIDEVNNLIENPGQAYTFEGGLTESSGTVELGGTLTGITTLSYDHTANFIISGARTGLGASRGQFTYNNLVFSVSPSEPHDPGNASDLTLNSSGAYLRWYNPGYTASGISFTSTAMQVIDSINTKGLVYSANYDTAGVLDDNWIPSYRAVKAYADSVGGGGGVTIGTDNQIPYVNLAGDDFEYSANFTYNGNDLIVDGNIYTGTNGDHIGLDSSNYISGIRTAGGRLDLYGGDSRGIVIQASNVGFDKYIYPTGTSGTLDMGTASLFWRYTYSTRFYVDSTAYISYSGTEIQFTDGVSGTVSLSSLAGGGGVTMTNGVDNRITTASGASSINGEANLTFNGTLLTVTGNLYISGATVNFTGLGSDDTEDHVIAIDDTTGLLTKRSVASMSTGGTVTSVGLTAGNLIDLSGTNPITSSGTITIDVDLSELATSVTNGDGDYFVVVDSTNGQHKLTKSNINLSGFSNDAGWTSNAGTVTSVSGTGSVDGITLSGTVTGSGNLTLSGNINVGSVTGTLPVGNGGTGLTTVGANYILTGNGTAALTAESGLTYNGSTLAVTGAITATGEITAYSSDERLKTDIVRIIDPIGKVKRLNGVIYKWRQDVCKSVGFAPARPVEIGMIAQNLQSVIPDAVDFAPFDRDWEGNSISGEDYLTVRLEKVVPLLLEAIKELSDEVDRLKGK